jgi:hypothetical protein
MKQKYGFIYLWFDRKHKRYYVGRHWGYDDDYYICSSNWMRDAYNRRPHDLKRRIICCVADKTLLVDAEQHYLDMIRDEELGKRYYNLTKKGSGVNGRKAGQVDTKPRKRRSDCKYFMDNLSFETIENIKSEYGDGTIISYAALAQKYNVNKNYLYYSIRGVR